MADDVLVSEIAALVGRSSRLTARLKTKREIEELVAEISPRPDVPSRVAALPLRVAVSPPGSLQLPVAGDCSDPAQVRAAGAVGGALELPVVAQAVAPATGRGALIEPLAPRLIRCG